MIQNDFYLRKSVYSVFEYEDVESTSFGISGKIKMLFPESHLTWEKLMSGYTSPAL